MFSKRFYKVKKKLDQLKKKTNSKESDQIESVEIYRFPLNTPCGRINITAKIFRSLKNREDRL